MNSFPDGQARRPVLFYDGECGLCNALVRFLLRIDRRGRLFFAPLQGPTAQAFLRAHGLDTETFDSLVFVPDLDRPEQGFHLRTDGVLRLLAEVGGGWRAFGVFKALPHAWRDAAYRLVARWRYRLFGEYRPRPLPNPAWARRFLP